MAEKEEKERQNNSERYNGGVFVLFETVNLYTGTFPPTGLYRVNIEPGYVTTHGNGIIELTKLYLAKGWFERVQNKSHSAFTLKRRDVRCNYCGANITLSVKEGRHVPPNYTIFVGHTRTMHVGLLDHTTTTQLFAQWQQYLR